VIALQQSGHISQFDRLASSLRIECSIESKLLNCLNVVIEVEGELSASDVVDKKKNMLACHQACALLKLGFEQKAALKEISICALLDRREDGDVSKNQFVDEALAALIFSCEDYLSVTRTLMPIAFPRLRCQHLDRERNQVSVLVDSLIQAFEQD